MQEKVKMNNKKDESINLLNIISENWITPSSVCVEPIDNNGFSYNLSMHLWKAQIEKGTIKLNVLNKNKSMLKQHGKTQIIPCTNSYLDKVENKWMINGLTYRPLRQIGNETIVNMLNSINVDDVEQELSKSNNFIPIGGNKNYGHFIFEFLPKVVWALSTIGSECNFIINKSCKKWIALIDILALIICKKIPNYSIIDDQKVKKYSCLNPIFIESSFAINSNYYSCFETLNVINRAVINTYGNKYIQKKIYLSRKEGPNTWRQLENKLEIQSIFKKKGYEIMNLSELSQEDQLKLLANTSEIVVEGGADSYSTIFCPRGCKIIELIPNNFVNGFGPISMHVPLEQNYQRVEGKVKEYNRGKLLIDKNFEISPWLVE